MTPSDWICLRHGDDAVMYSPRQKTTRPQPGQPWQYSLKTLFLITLGLAVALAVVVSFPNGIAVPLLICLAIAIPAFLTVVAIYGSGYQRTFSIGALFPTCTLLYATGWLMGLTLIEGPGPSTFDSLGDWLELFDEVGGPYRVYTGSAWLLAVAVGWMAVGVRYRLERRARRDDEET
jgi:hypothetical protein